ncbi:hypothetical protein ACLOJK_007037 [Asimina triloba]
MTARPGSSHRPFIHLRPPVPVAAVCRRRLCPAAHATLAHAACRRRRLRPPSLLPLPTARYRLIQRSRSHNLSWQQLGNM